MLGALPTPRYFAARDFLGGEEDGWGIPSIPAGIIGATTDILWAFAWR